MEAVALRAKLSAVLTQKVEDGTCHPVVMLAELYSHMDRTMEQQS